MNTDQCGTDCPQVPTLKRLEEERRTMHAVIFGNGGTGLKEQIARLTAELEDNTRRTGRVEKLLWGVAATVIVTAIVTLVKSGVVPTVS